jgi:hypothetical protein
LKRCILRCLRDATRIGRWRKTSKTSITANAFRSNGRTLAFLVVRLIEAGPTSSIITRSRGREIESKQREEKSRKKVLEASFPTEQSPTDEDEPVELAFGPEAQP